MTTPSNAPAIRNAQAKVANILEMMRAYKALLEAPGPVTAGAETYDDMDSLLEHMYCLPLAVDVRHGWVPAGQAPVDPTEYRLQLTTGGPACQIVGELNIYGEPITARVEFSDWYVPHAEIPLELEDYDSILDFVRLCFPR